MLDYTLIVGLISALLGYLLGKNSCGDKLEDCQKKQNILRSEKEKLQAEYDAKLKTKETEIADLKSKLISSESLVTKTLSFTAVPTLIPFDADAAKAVYGKKVKQDDLTLVEGIGPKIQELFKSNGIPTWKVLSETEVTRLQEILGEGGERFAIHNPGTWPRQAKLAYEGKWQELKDWQDKLFGGVEPEA